MDNTQLKIRHIKFLYRSNGDQLKITTNMRIEDSKPFYTQTFALRKQRTSRSGKVKTKWLSSARDVVSDEELHKAKVELWESWYPEW